MGFCSQRPAAEVPLLFPVRGALEIAVFGFAVLGFGGFLNIIPSLERLGFVI